MASHDLGADSAPCNSNIVKLPTAARRQVKNSAPAIRAYRASQPKWPGDYKWPAARVAETLAKQLEINRTPELLLVMCILKELTSDQRLKIKNNVLLTALHFGDPAANLALDVITGLTRGDSMSKL